MKTFFAAIGATLAALMLLAMVGAIDMRLCVGAPDTCNPVDAKPAARTSAKVMV
ncbi:hypothetical protein Bcep22_gp46 [Burkholderia phage Bcep22]|uniref:Uncharacterized protein n=1 Tax=Burkholderia phage Bcep22 TaxID=2883944 RepID=Q6V7P7_9CAUD|nr:hypothetical protein Bcep22_gp46 [Burkholderia phage Bcep22]AAQ54979.1 hypothetical protein Bcep22_gp46 [Burkholderia phage Bcep22]